MGQSKTELFLGRVAAAAAPAFTRVVAVQRAGTESTPLSTIFEADHADEAPIFGVAAALEHAKSACFILATDYAFVTTEALRFVKSAFERSKADLVLPMYDEKPQLLCAGYRPEVLGVIRERVAAGKLDLRGLMSVCSTELIPEAELRQRFAPRTFVNVNTPADLLAAENLS